MGPFLRRVAILHIKGVKSFVVEQRRYEAHMIGLNTGHFLPEIVEEVKEATLSVHNLKGVAHDFSLLGELGQKAEIELPWMIILLKEQDKNTEGPLLINGTNIAYIRDLSGNLCVFDASLNSTYGHWNVGYGPIGHWHGRFGSRCRIVSRSRFSLRERAYGFVLS